MKKKIIAITGASSGIGYTTAVKAQKEGHTVIWGSRNIESNSLIKKLLVNDSILVNIDVADENSVKKFFQKIDNKFGRLDAIVNSAGYVDPEPMLSTSFENWNKTISTNLTGLFLCCKYASLIMKKVGGSIINIASTAGLSARPGWSAYAASKSGVINFSKAIAEELIEYSIKIFIICPGRTATPLRSILAPNENPQVIMQPESVADIILFTMKDEAKVLEGQPILVRDRF